MNWDWLDYLVAGGLLATVAGCLVLAVRVSGNTTFRVAAVVGLVAALLLLWVNAAVGIIGSEDNDANMLYFGVLAVGIVGALRARFRPAGMSRALVATAIAQALVPAIALIAGLAGTGPGWPWDVLVLTAFFCGLWLLSAWFFRAAGVRRTSEVET